jgi:hypothetical protein
MERLIDSFTEGLIEKDQLTTRMARTKTRIADLDSLLRIPPNIVPVAYLCLGYVDHFAAEPDLERAGWEHRIPLDQVLGFDRYDLRWSAEEKKP